MKKRVLSMLIAAVISFAALPPSFANEIEEKEVVKVYVSPNAVESPNGTIQRPFTDLHQMQQYVRKLKNSLKRPTEIQVIFRGGDYRLLSPLELTSEDSGFDNEHRIVYMAYEDEKPRIKGSVEIDVTKIKKVTDQKILKRLDNNAREKIGYINLREQGIESISGSVTGSYSRHDSALAYTSIYLDGVEQNLSQWPNGEYEWKTFTIVSKGNTVLGSNGGGTFKYHDTSRPSRWLDAKDGYIQGFFAYDYYTDKSEIASVNPEASTITLKYGVNNGIMSGGSKRWKAFNMLEEIDRPGEWYIDRDNMYLYYYPPYGMRNSVMEIAVLDDDMIRFKNVENLTFRGLEFSQTRAHCMYACNETVRNVTIDKCTFTDIGCSPITFLTYENTTFGDEAGTNGHYNGKAWNIEVTNNIFYNHGASIMFNSGNVTEMLSGGLVFKNNYVTQPNARDTAYGFSGYIVGADVSHNVIHNVPAQGYSAGGLNTEFKYNEAVNVVREYVDCGAFYVGRTVLQRGLLYEYNYVYNAYPVQETTNKIKHNRAFYLDDGFAGATIRNNIMVSDDGEMSDKASSTTGSGSYYYDNTIVDFPNTIVLMQRGDYNPYKELLSEQYEGNPGRQLYLDTYPEIIEESELLKANGYTSTVNNVVSGNLIVNGADPITHVNENVTKYNTFENTILEDNYDMFVDPDNYDYRVKKDSQAYSKNPKLVSEDFDYDLIGIQWEEGFDKNRILERRNFRKLYPENGATEVPSIDLQFNWQKCFGADEYKFVLATDPDFKNIVSEQTVPYNWCYVPELQDNYTDYYWKVSAVNETKSLHDEWNSSGVTYRFTTEKNEFLDFTALETIIDKVNKIYPYIVDGTTGGTFKPGTKAEVDKYLKLANEALSWKQGEHTMQELDELGAKLEEAISNKNINDGIYDIKDIIGNKDMWHVVNASVANVDFENGEIYMDTLDDNDEPIGAVQIECPDVEVFSTKNLYAFSVKPDYNGNGWMGISVRCSDLDRAIYTGETYLFVVKPDIIEVQVYSEGRSGIMETFPNTYFKSGQWHDVVFGAYDAGYGQVLVLMVDGKIIKQFSDYDSAQITKNGGIKFFMSQPGNLSIRPITELASVDFNDILVSCTDNALVEMCQKVEKFYDSDLFITYDNTNVYFKEDKLYSTDAPILKTVNGIDMIRADLIDEMMPAEVNVTTDSAEITYNGKTIVFNKDVNSCTSNGESRKLDKAPFESQGYLYVPTTVLTNEFSYNMINFRGLLAVSKTGNNDLVNSISLAVATIEAFKRYDELK